MLSILSTYTYQDGTAFPNTGAVDSSGGVTTDGTEFIAAMINDYMFGILQAELDYTGQTPNGTVEGPSNSQHLESLRRAFSYPGDIFASAINDDPATLGIRAIKLIGQGILRANYPELDAAVYVGDGNNATASAFFRADDSGGVTRNTTGVYLILPDLRGYVVRGLDTAAGVDPDGASRDLGHVQDFAIENITGGFYSTKFYGGVYSSILRNPFGAFSQTLNIDIGYERLILNTSTNSDYHHLMEFDASTVVNTSIETRGVNIAFNYYIRY